MSLLIDCYNLLHATMPPGLAGLDEAGLIRVLSRSSWMRGRIAIVCDGRPKPGIISTSPVDGIKLIYSGRDRSADDVIVELIAGDHTPRRLTVVSSDREIQKAARHRKAIALTSEQFIRQLPGALRPPGGEPPKPGGSGGEGMPGPAVKKWAKEFGVDPDMKIG